MKKIIYGLFFASSLVLGGCDGFLDVVPENDIKTIETTFEKREDAYQWLKTCYSMITYETGHIIHNPAFWGADEVIADDWFRMSSGITAAGIYIGDGLQMAQNPYGNVWLSSKFYGGIRYCNIFIKNIDGVYNMLQDEKNIWKAEIKALKAHYYFELMRRYGPIVLVPENIDAAASIKEMQQPRRPIDECVQAIVDLCDEAIPELPFYKEQVQTHFCYFNKEAAATLKAMALLYAASPLFNGNKMLENMVNKNGERLFPAYDKEKWKLAAEAADEALAFCDQGRRKLVSGNSDRPSKILNIMRDIEKSSVDYGYTNTEAILLFHDQYSEEMQFYHPVFQSSDQYYYDASTTGGFSASMKMVEMFYTEHGLPLSEDKQWMSSRYAMSKEVDERYKDVLPLNTDVLSLHRRREPRFYADIVAHGTYWYRRAFSYSGTNYERLLVNCLQGKQLGTLAKKYDSSGPQCLSGYYVKKFDNSEVPLKGYYYANRTERAQVIFRLPDLLLASAEAWNEYLDTPDDRVYNPLDKLRERAGLMKVRDAWQGYARNPSKVTRQDGMREIIRHEWNVEFAFEGRRFYNLRRWMTAHQELNSPLYGWNILGDTERKFYNDYDKPIPVWNKRSFTAPRDYFYPIGSEEVMIMGDVQNPGW
ncbi:MAG TPA: RagB/SusD family nutrient uptake outer membrane protein [Porphyromonadaceae bacterium]|jgi:hypothetical protein|nr:RagB/SusD family nutrient uptake outer membrane protein [Porphyromonadaceae bacterium]HBL33689.1 RagB/SusD family nutrient uptake outer membrane protein [Porphyromonadaceae bacterium]HBX19668.1 RagB/SusD family nutrient uptake outer membrane protein [Porphyromonadaceae bacterium]HCM20930.1 RagB/SusD family nutrient uptake outer membrane protein [Porphyromonadaceae bacterium]